jgi:hypothetical protein
VNTNWDNTKNELRKHNSLQNLNRQCILASKETEDSTDKYHLILEEAKEVMYTLRQTIERNTPRTKAKIKDAPWWMEKIRKLHDIATKAINRWRRKGTERHRTTYKRHQKRPREEIRKATLEHWIKSLEDIDTRNPWSMLRKKREGSTVPQLINTEGQQVSEHKDKAEELIKRLFPNQPNTDATLDHNPLGFTKIMINELGKIIHSILDGKSPGSDGIPPRGIKVLFQVYLQIILQILDASLYLGKLPECWKLSTGVVIWKAWKPHYSDPKAYRVICLIPIISKLLEKVVTSRLY